MSHELTVLCWWVHDGETLPRAAEGTRPPLPPHPGSVVSPLFRNLEELQNQDFDNDTIFSRVPLLKTRFNVSVRRGCAAGSGTPAFIGHAHQSK